MGVSIRDIGKTLWSIKSAIGNNDEVVSLSFVVDADASPNLVTAVRHGFVPMKPTAHVRVCRLGNNGDDVGEYADATVVILGSHVESVHDHVARIQQGTSVAVLVDDTSANAQETAGSIVEACPGVRIVRADERNVVERLASWLANTLSEKGPSLAACFPACREPIASRTVLSTTRDNALVGALTFIGGADAPVMFANEVTMALRLASVYGVAIDASRLVEVAGLGGLSVVSKLASKLLCRAVPVPDFILKPIVASATTMVAGRALREYYKNVSEGVVSITSEDVVGTVRQLVGKVV